MKHITQVSDVSSYYREAIIRERGKEVLTFIEKYVSIDDISLTFLLDTGSYFNLKSLQNFHGLFNNAVNNVINLKKLNDVKYVNKFLEESNIVLSTGGFFVGSIETQHRRKKRILSKYPIAFSRMIYFLDFIVKRVFPKFTITKRIYFFLTQGRNRVISDMEIFGRLYSCGFELVDSLEIHGRLWFIGKKTGHPAFDNEATYGPLIKLSRHGKGNKLFKVYKLRTMYPYSEYLQPYIASKYGLQKGGKFKDDPRVTTLGKFLRRFWLDELPMFVNLLKGQMKLFGVRPLSGHYLSLYPKHIIDLRAKVKPGLIPPFYADLPESLEEIVKSEETYILSYLQRPILTDIKYLYKALYNIFVKKARSN